MDSMINYHSSLEKYLQNAMPMCRMEMWLWYILIVQSY